MRVAIMQPYLYPYAGYFRLLEASDVFVLYDDVQFIRRGRIHRCEMASGHWLTLPLARQPRDTMIRDIQWREGARAELDKRLSSFNIPREGRNPVAAMVCNHLYGPLGNMVDFLEAGIRLVAGAVGLSTKIVRSSGLNIDPSLRGQERIVGIVRAIGGRDYVNAPGGRGLYDARYFAEAGLGLQFLESYSGRFFHILEPLFKGDACELGRDIRHTCTIER